MENPYETPIDLYVLMHRILSDPLPGEADVIYCFSETSDNQRSVLKKAAELCATGRAPLIAVADGCTTCGYPGYDTWRDELLRVHGVYGGSVVPIEHKDRSQINTYSEFEEFLTVAQEKTWRSVIIVAPPLHLVRALITAVSVTLKKPHKTPIAVYAQCGIAESWHTTVFHSQGTTVGTRRELLSGELWRLGKYFTKGDLLSPNAILRYLDWRDGVNQTQ